MTAARLSVSRACRSCRYCSRAERTRVPSRFGWADGVVGRLGELGESFLVVGADPVGDLVGDPEARGHAR